MFQISLLWKALIVCGALLAGVSSYKYLGMKQDNRLEEAAEKVIQIQTGSDVDLSPDTVETTTR